MARHKIAQFNDWTRRNPEKYKKWQQEYYKRTHPAKEAKRRERYKNDKEYRERIRSRNRETKYGLNEGEFQVLVDSQNGLCAICKKAENNKKTDKLYVDHSHETGKVRGLLCNKCNVALGLVNDSLDVLTKMIEYLKNHS